MVKKDDREWVLEHFRALEADAKRVADIHPDVVEEVGAWTALKHMTIRNSLGMYLGIIGRASWAKTKTYIDTNSSCGINRLKDTKFQIAGSSIIGACTQTRFDCYHFIEPDKGKREALEARLAKLLPMDKVRVYAEPADDALPKIMAEVPKWDAHYFAVVDPYALSDITWKGLSTLMAHPRGDVLINFQTTHVKRAGHRVAEEFFGSPEVKALIDANAPEAGVRDLFLRRVQTLRPKTEFMTVKSGDSRYYYDLVYAAAGTKGDNPWLKAVRGIKERVERLSGATVLDILENQGLAAFVGEDDGKPPAKPAKGGRQTTLDTGQASP